MQAMEISTQEWKGISKIKQWNVAEIQYGVRNRQKKSLKCDFLL